MEAKRNTNNRLSMDENLIEKIKQGDVRAFEKLYRCLYERLCNYAYSILRDHELAEETVDDVFFYLWDHRGEIEFSSLEAYLSRSVHNRSLNALHAKANRWNKDNTVPVDEVMQYMRTLFDDDHPLKLLLGKEQNDLIREAIADLPPQCRKVFGLSRYEHLTYSEIATRMGISVNTVKYHIGYALQVLTKRLKPYLMIMVLMATG